MVDDELGNPVVTSDNLCHHYTGVVPEGGHDTIVCDTPQSGRHVYVIRDMGSHESHFIQLCEVFVYGYKSTGKSNNKHYNSYEI